MLDHLSVLKAVDGLFFLSNTKPLGKREAPSVHEDSFAVFLHLFYNFQLQQSRLRIILFDIKVETSNKIDMDNRFVVCVNPMVNFVSDLGTSVLVKRIQS